MGDSDSVDAFSFRKKKPIQDDTVQNYPPPQIASGVSPEEDTYNMAHNKRGKAIIFNNCIFEDKKLTPRNEAGIDVKNMTTTLEALKFEVEVYIDPKYSDIYDILTKTAEEDHSDNDCFIVVVMTHGTADKLYAKDYSYSPDMLWDPFTGDCCATLAGKPKLFFIEATTGDKIASSIDINFTTYDAYHVDKYMLPAMADFLIMYSTLRGYQSFKNSNGSWFIQSLCKELDKRAGHQDIMQILTFVNRTLTTDFVTNEEEQGFEDKKQVGSIVSSLTRLLRFYSNK